MKARIKETGEIIDVKFSVHPNPAVDETFWWCKDKQESYHTWELDFLEVDTTRKFIDWEQRRYEIAKEAMGALISSPSYQFCEVNNYYEVYIEPSEDVAKDAVKYADALIEELKGGEQ